jgi:hypothetical protein
MKPSREAAFRCYRRCRTNRCFGGSLCDQRNTVRRWQPDLSFRSIYRRDLHQGNSVSRLGVLLESQELKAEGEGAVKFVPEGRCFTFEIPDDWWIEAGMSAFKPTTPSYAWRSDPERPTLPVIGMPIDRIRRGPRNRDGGDFHRGRMVSVLQGIARGDRIPPVPITPLAGEPRRFSHQLRGGFHRFSASIAARYLHIPVVVVDDF